VSRPTCRLWLTACEDRLTGRVGSSRASNRRKLIKNKEKTPTGRGAAACRWPSFPHSSRPAGYCESVPKGTRNGLTKMRLIIHPNSASSVHRGEAQSPDSCSDRVFPFSRRTFVLPREPSSLAGIHETAKYLL